ncbi:MAG: ParA family protein [Gallionellaceae bacterium]
MAIVTVFNQKGGVGKTTTAINLAAALSLRGLKLGLIDLDPQAQLGSIIGVTASSGESSVYSFFKRNRPLRELIQESSSGIGVIPSHTEISKVDALLGKGYSTINKLNLALQLEKKDGLNDHWIIDCCPSVGVLSLNAIFAADCIIVPIAADYLSLKGAMQIQKTLKALERVLKRRIPRRYLITRYDSRRKMAINIFASAKQEFGDDVCRTLIRENVSLAESPSLNKTIFEHAPNSHGAHDYNALLDELLADGFLSSYSDNKDC